MGWFGKKEKKSREVLSLPELPKISEAPKIGEEIPKQIHQLPMFPNNPLGEKFSQNTIKEAITGKKEDDEFSEADDSIGEKNQDQIIPEPIATSIIEDAPENLVEKEKIGKTMQKEEPVFIRIDKFKESSRALEEIKNKIKDVEKALEGIRKLKEKENTEIESWEKEIHTIKTKIANIDEDIFSKVN